MTTSPVSVPARQVRRLLPMTWLVLAATIFLAGCVALWPPDSTMSDQRVYYAAAKGFVDGQDIYTIHRQYPGMGLGFTYPPFAALVFTPLALGQEFGRLAITLLSAIALLVITWLSVGAVRPRWSVPIRGSVALVCAAVALITEPLRGNFGLGQINLLLVALLLVDLLGKLPPRYRGVLVGLATGMKLTPGIFILYLLVTRQFRAAAVAAGTTAGTMLAGWLVMPTATVDFWTKYIFDPGRPGPAHYISNQSIRGTLARLMDGSAQVGPLWLLLAGMVGCAGLVIARRLYEPGRPLAAIVVTAFTGLLVSPISWSNHWVWLVPAAILLWSQATTPGRRVLAAVWTTVFLVKLPWHAPWGEDEEFRHTMFQAVIGNSYGLLALALLLVGLLAGNVLGGGRPADAGPPSTTGGHQGGWCASGGPREPGLTHRCPLEAEGHSGGWNAPSAASDAKYPPPLKSRHPSKGQKFVRFRHGLIRAVLRLSATDTGGRLDQQLTSASVLR